MIEALFDVAKTIESITEWTVNLEEESSHLLRESLELAVEFARKDPQPFKSHTGKLNRSIDTRMRGALTGQLFTNRTAPYAGFVEFGRGPVRPVRAKVLRFQINGRWISSKFVKPAYARPFMRPAVEDAAANLETKLVHMISKL